MSEINTNAPTPTGTERHLSGHSRGRGRGSNRGGARPAGIQAPQPQISQEPTKQKSQRPNPKRDFKSKDSVPDLGPKSKSTTASAEKNDPLINDLLTIEGVTGFVEVARERTFELDFSGYMQLIRTSYDAQMAFDRSMRKYVSFSAYQYYCTIALWKRLLDVSSSRGILTLEHLQINQVLAFDFPLPTDIQMYLQGVGDIRDASGLLKMQADLNPQANLDWDLPVGLRPLNPGAQLPTENLLGWRRKERLSEDQRTTLEEGGVTAEAVFPRNIANIPILPDLLKSIADRLETSKCKAIAIFPTSTSGSLAQVSFMSRSPDDVEIEPFRNIATKLARTNSYTQTVAGIASSSAIMRYRIQRSTNGEADSICYRFEANATPNNTPRKYNPTSIP
ncbi:uncharacterized protein LOC124293400 [Neodiprion lecontei]|uniref:Uncharacterized protein LOC124293400 n=1 Tax=Neodiprion lecontei TaxID=441921 RepID=A0ABM3FQ99_NEOLC|nr:uncharacterized protein LOC124293400 [Neodiprion lecontei]